MKRWLPIALLIILSVISHWSWFCNFELLTARDWPFLFNESASEHLSIPYAWWTKVNFGDVHNTPTVYPFLWLYGFFSSLDIDYAHYERFIFFWPVAIVSVVGSYLLVKRVTNSTLGSVLGSLVFCYNTPFLILQTSTMTIAAAYAFVPLFFYFLIKTVDEKEMKWSVLTALVGFIISFYEFRIFYIIFFAAGIYYFLVFFSEFKANNSIKSFVKTVLLMLSPMAIIFLLNSYWLIYFIFGKAASNLLFLQRGLFGNQYFSLDYSLNLYSPFWNNGSPVDFDIAPLPIYYWLVPIIIAFGLYFVKKREEVFFAVGALLGILLSKQIAEPWPDLYKWLFENIVGFNAFREAGKFYILIALGYSVIVGILAANLIRLSKSSKNGVVFKLLYFLVSVAVICIFAFNSIPLITQKIGNLFVSTKIPVEYLNFKDYLLKQDQQFRLLWLPADIRYGYFSNQHPRVEMGAVFENWWKTYLPIFYNPKYSINDQFLYLINSAFSERLISLSGIKYILIPYDRDDEIFKYYADLDFKSSSLVRKYWIERLSKIEWLDRIDSKKMGELAIFENKRFVPHIYVTNNKLSLYKEIPVQEVEWKYVNPTKYVVRLKRMKDPFLLNFTEMYHPGWRIFLGKIEKHRLLFSSDSLVDENHFKNVALLNSFQIDPEIIKNNYDNYTVNEDGSIDFDLTIYFTPQNYYYLGSVISGATFVSIISYLLIKLIGRKKKVLA